MKVDLDALEATAKAATPGPWMDGASRNRWGLVIVAECPGPDLHRVVYAKPTEPCVGRPDHSHIAANSPDVTLALVARIRELEAALIAAGTTLEARTDRDFRREAAQSFYAIAAKGVTP